MRERDERSKKELEERIIREKEERVLREQRIAKEIANDKEKIKHLLARARELDDSFECIQQMRKELRLFGLTLDYVGTDEGELAVIIANHCKQQARKYFVAGRDFGPGEDRFAHMWMYLIRGGLTFADIGTSEEEYEKLPRNLL